jgi:hypothetical protein
MTALRRPPVTAVVLSWNGRDDTLSALASLTEATYPALSVMVVDNGSHDGSVEAVRAHHPDVRIVALPDNRGFAGGMNAGIETALAGDAAHVLLLNNDMTFEPGFVEPLVEASGADVAAVCAQILFAGAPSLVWFAGADYDPRRGYQGRQTGYRRAPVPASTPPYVSDRACGGAVLMSRTALELVGGFDEELFAYAEDVDWSLRARAAGLRIVVAPGSVVHHAVSASSGGEASPATIYYSLRNGLAVAERAAPLSPIGTWRRRGVALLATLAQVMITGNRRAGTRAALAGLADARAGRLGVRDGGTT